MNKTKGRMYACISRTVRWEFIGSHHLGGERVGGEQAGECQAEGRGLMGKVAALQPTLVMGHLLNVAASAAAQRARRNPASYTGSTPIVLFKLTYLQKRGGQYSHVSCLSESGPVNRAASQEDWRSMAGMALLLSD